MEMKKLFEFWFRLSQWKPSSAFMFCPQNNCRWSNVEARLHYLYCRQFKGICPPLPQFVNFLVTIPTCTAFPRLQQQREPSFFNTTVPSGALDSLEQWDFMLRMHEDGQLFRFLLLLRCELAVLWRSESNDGAEPPCAKDICCAHVRLTFCWRESSGGLHEQSWARSGSDTLDTKIWMRKTVGVKLAWSFLWRGTQGPQERVLTGSSHSTSL